MTDRVWGAQGKADGAPGWAVWEGDCCRLLESLPRGAFDAVVADPPYSSGGLMRSDRTREVLEKYRVVGKQGYSGDNRDQRSWGNWCAGWLHQCFQATVEGGLVMLFTDWRQLPTLSDALQASGYIWRGVVVWDKTEAAKPERGRFRHQAEYILWGTRGVLPLGAGECLPGVFRCGASPAEKQHPSAKPLALLRQVLRIVPDGAVVLDPFAGSATAGVVCLETGRGYLGLELSPAWVEVSRARMAQASAVLPGTGPVPTVGHGAKLSYTARALADLLRRGAYLKLNGTGYALVRTSSWSPAVAEEVCGASAAELIRAGWLWEAEPNLLGLTFQGLVGAE